MLSGSAGPSCPTDKLVVASEFVRYFTGETLRRGGGLVVLAGNEESTRDENGIPHIFDWLALRRGRKICREFCWTSTAVCQDRHV